MHDVVQTNRPNSDYARMASRDELMWHLVYMIAGHEMDSADDRLSS